VSHEAAAAYALGALDDAEQREFQEHLTDCAECKQEIEALKGTAASLAFAADLPPAPPGLRDRILEQAVAERAVIVPLRRRIILPAVAAAGIAAAVALGIWVATLSNSLDRERSVRKTDARALAILAAPDNRAVSLTGAEGQLVVSGGGDAALVVRNLPAAPRGKAYEIWVIEGTAQPRPAGLFSGGRTTIVALKIRVPAGALVAVTLERSGGSARPTTQPLMRTQAV
jgi:anti-sigma-K factor RskA